MTPRDHDDEPISFLRHESDARFNVRFIELEMGAERPFEAIEWCDELVVVERGSVELETVAGDRLGFDRGAVLFLDAMPIRLLRNRGPSPVLISAVSRRRPRPQTPD